MRWTAASSLAFVPAAVEAWRCGSRRLAAVAAAVAMTSTVHHWHRIRPDLYRHGRLVAAADVFLAKLLVAWACATLPSLPTRSRPLAVLLLLYIVIVFQGVLARKPKSCYDPRSVDYCWRTMALHVSLHLAGAALVQLFAPFVS